MQTRVSTKGQVVLPGPLRRKLGLRTGDRLEASIENGRIVLAPETKRARRVRITKDTLTGLPVLDAGADAPALTSREVEEILASFP
ncbi:AbrB/MazE/SpoVT family DNA-binding domain-containing protein [Alloacidobacterium dinghuense]|uniref:AbrB/MazE/SpoVT family DNA-binding domain-containing protein n=1 Tax=Alloacidobacterium dinghuense TaxID=2763107 RepID=A0A7G8BIN7_9BACT|nr:AbrB/MazE/SpoVT family DNA-binding domain-containing protein [Alloacidobacterium dinghuense]QNI32407.1 AbrB/MazE/SpoVT family DNA-binding domain-containing protein [Alloacidobacterium dinghuense]